MPKTHDFNVDFWKIFLGGRVDPDDPILERGLAHAHPHVHAHVHLREGHLDCQVLRAPQYLNPALFTGNFVLPTVLYMHRHISLVFSFYANK